MDRKRSTTAIGFVSAGLLLLSWLSQGCQSEKDIGRIPTRYVPNQRLTVLESKESATAEIDMGDPMIFTVCNGLSTQLLVHPTGGARLQLVSSNAGKSGVAALSITVGMGLPAISLVLPDGSHTYINLDCLKSNQALWGLTVWRAQRRREDDQIERIVPVQDLKIVDKDGKGLLILGITHAGDPALAFLDTNDHMRASWILLEEEDSEEFGIFDSVDPKLLTSLVLRRGKTPDCLIFAKDSVYRLDPVNWDHLIRNPTALRGGDIPWLGRSTLEAAGPLRLTTARGEELWRSRGGESSKAEASRTDTIPPPVQPQAPSARKAAETKIIGTGSGFFVTSDGYLLTAAHVVRGGGRIAVRTSAGELPAEVVKTDLANDIAVLKVLGVFQALPLGNAAAVTLGSSAFTIGFPNIVLQGLEPKLTKGEINSLAGIQDDPRHFQTSVQVHAGNSGGALIDERGNVIGVVLVSVDAAKMLKVTGTMPQNLNYAVKISYAKTLLESIPDAARKLLPVSTRILPFSDVVKSAQAASVLVVVWK